MVEKIYGACSDDSSLTLYTCTYENTLLSCFCVYFVAVLHDHKITSVQRDAGSNGPSTPYYSTFWTFLNTVRTTWIPRPLKALTKNTIRERFWEPNRPSCPSRSQSSFSGFAWAEENCGRGRHCVWSYLENLPWPWWKSYFIVVYFTAYGNDKLI